MKPTSSRLFNRIIVVIFPALLLLFAGLSYQNYQRQLTTIENAKLEEVKNIAAAGSNFIPADFLEMIRIDNSYESEMYLKLREKLNELINKSALHSADVKVLRL